VRAFQAARGLPPTGVCDDATWSAILEARYELGDRLLYQRRPMQRGDDVALLQGWLNHLGFDAGRVDGIFGPDTARALEEFQRNSGLAPDAICGPATVAALERLGRNESADGASGIASLREGEALREGSRRLPGTRVTLGADHATIPLARALGHALRSAGAAVTIVQDPQPSGRAAAANTIRSAAHLDLTVGAAAAAQFYATQSFTSSGGRRLATLVVRSMIGLPGAATAPTGSRLPILRETRMPAIALALPPELLERPSCHESVRRLAIAVRRWIEVPVLD
jgi:N-acetylmuramoyl-L-alanine amidase